MNHENTSGATRRQALRATSAFLILPAAAAWGYAANEKLNIGVIGVRGMGGVDARTLRDLGENIVALCDVDATAIEKRAPDHPRAKHYTDFREMIAKEKLDGVVVATPDHNHAYIGVYAMKHGLHVYGEKPLCQSVHEARVMARVAAEMKVVTQMGTSSSAEPNNLRTIELIQSGALGEITEIHMATDRPIWPQGYAKPEGEDPAPSTLNWDLWLGTAQARPFKAKWPEGHAVYGQEKRPAQGGALYHPFVWRGWTDFGSGALGDIAPHSMNVVFMALDLGAPTAVEVVETSGMMPEMYPAWSVIRFEWAARGAHPPMKLCWYDGGKRPPESIVNPPRRVEPETPLPGGGGGMTWIGTKGSFPRGRGPFADGPLEPYPAPPQRDWHREGVHKDWVTAIKAGKQAPCHFGYAGPFTEAYQLGNIALRIRHRIEWDPLAFRITNCREANQYLFRDYRKGWDLREVAGAAACDVAPRNG